MVTFLSDDEAEEPPPSERAVIDSELEKVLLDTKEEQDRAPGSGIEPVYEIMLRETAQYDLLFPSIFSEEEINDYLMAWAVPQIPTMDYSTQVIHYFLGNTSLSSEGITILTEDDDDLQKIFKLYNEQVNKRMLTATTKLYYGTYAPRSTT